ncbi:hypothetical protein Sme01_72920 [Sphaerisporangium melleum]|uniref:Uncharacterized protein n=1 Tax=Sphaerisporangium melleum TaxID=321316 RepID=A0A917RP62_9ACTN|nr:hypothetical protein GCM10007964_69770 [Sphaerisporangium melleum]GII74816.1 hypothetical protein Sme01_72920 [Sphaerisporangium melleum]
MPGQESVLRGMTVPRGHGRAARALSYVGRWNGGEATASQGGKIAWSGLLQADARAASDGEIRAQGRPEDY